MRRWGQKRSVKIDRILTHRIFAIPIFLGIMVFIFWITFGVVGSTLSDWFSAGIDYLVGLADSGLQTLQVNETLRGLLIDGVCSGVGSVLSFLPTIVLLFFLLSILEDSGYMARVAFVMDRLLRKIGLSGRSFVPMLIGFGCSVPAIMATRTLSGDRDRKLTILLVPFMSCSAKLPIYAMFTAAFFEEYRALVMVSLYVGGVLIGILCGLVMKKLMFSGEPVPFRHGASGIPHAGGAKRSASHVGQSEGFHEKSFHRHLRGIHHHLVPAELRHPPLIWFRTAGTACWRISVI